MWSAHPINGRFALEMLHKKIGKYSYIGGRRELWYVKKCINCAQAWYWMKCFCAILASIPARVSWIEIMDRLCGLRKQGSRYLRGYRGLKYTSYTSTKFIKLSIPARVSWIEIHECQLLALPDTVDTCEGIVDWNAPCSTRYLTTSSRYLQGYPVLGCIVNGLMYWD